MLINFMPNKSRVHKKYKNNDIGATKIFGFWIYLMSDLILFACLFATYGVLVHRTAGGPIGKDIFNLNLVLVESVLLLFSSMTYACTMIAMHIKKIHSVKLWLLITFLLGLGFLIIEAYEFSKLLSEGYGPNHSAFLSIFFTLLGTHGIHVSFGLVWILIMIIHISRHNLTRLNQIRLNCLSLFWHFLDIIWICIFSVVYLLGSIR